MLTETQVPLLYLRSSELSTLGNGPPNLQFSKIPKDGQKEGETDEEPSATFKEALTLGADPALTYPWNNVPP